MCVHFFELTSQSTHADIWILLKPKNQSHRFLLSRAIRSSSGMLKRAESGFHGGVCLKMSQKQIDESISQGARRGAAVISIVAAVTLATRLYLQVQQSDGLLDALSYMSQYFTILTNAMTLLIMLWIAAGRGLPPRLIKSVSIAIVGVGIVYHALLAHLVTLTGIDLLADHGTHTFVPLLTGLWWVFLAPKPTFRWSDVPLWVAWPMIYCGYILIRASFSGFYPYPFLNVPEIGWNGLLVSIAGLVLAFAIIGLVMTVLGHFVPSRRR